MKYLHLGDLPPACYLAAEEALLDQCEESGEGEMLLFWESTAWFVVLGYANKVAAEVDVEACDSLGIPILRRCSGGGTVLQGPGCLNYSLILRIESRPELQSISGTNRFVMGRQREIVESALGQPVRVQGHTDLTLGDRKFSGNAQRRKRSCLLFHGSILHDFDLPMIGKVLLPPPLQPEYRARRPHSDFVVNLPLPPTQLIEAFQTGWGADSPAPPWPEDRFQKALAERYSLREWHYRF